MFTIPGTFIGNFKLGDNIAHNLKIIGALYTLRAGGDADQKDALRKPIIVFNVSIIDAVLYDFYGKIHTLTREGIANLPSHIVSALRGVTVDRLAVAIDQASKHNLFGEPPAFYAGLHNLRKLRNRIHIQMRKVTSNPTTSSRSVKCA